MYQSYYYFFFFFLKLFVTASQFSQINPKSFEIPGRNGHKTSQLPQILLLPEEQV